MHRRTFLTTTLAATAFGPQMARAQGFEVTRTEAEWRAMLTDLEYEVMREDGTEDAFSSPLDKTYDPGTYHCRGCDQALYSSEAKFDSGTGWPSFTEALPGAIGTREDRAFLVLTRTECHCSRCGSHLGHIFDDGPKPTGKRHCLNGASLVFKPA